MKNVLMHYFLMAFVFLLLLISCGEKDQEIKPNEVIIENIAEIGNQVWMAKNLDVDTFNNGDNIPEANTLELWRHAAANKEPAWCYYEYDENKGSKYGKLYNWFAVTDNRGIAPNGWRVSSENDWRNLVTFISSEKTAYSLKSRDGWDFNGNGSDEYGFSALPAGRCTIDGSFSFELSIGTWWNNNNHNELEALYSYIHFDVDQIQFGDMNKGVGYSVRCLKNQ